jgi:hypothetical protein
MAQADNSTAPNVGSPASAPATSTKPSREQLIADLDRIAEKPAATNDNKPEAEPEKKPEPAPLPDADEDEDELPKGDDEKPEEKPEEDDAAKADPDLQKRLAIVAKHEKRAKEREAKVKAEIEQERISFRREREAFDREVAQARTEIGKFQELQGRARYDAIGVLRALGLTDDDIGPAARQLWAHSKEGPNDPKNRELAARMMKEREQEDRVSKLERELREERESRTKEQTEKQQQAQIEAYLTHIEKTASEEHPLFKRLVEKSPKKARLKIAEAAYSLAQRDGEEPDADDVLAEFERVERAELEERGIDVAAIIKQKPARKAESGTKTLGNDVTNQTASKNGAAKKSMAEKRAELEAELRAMDRKG